MKILIIIRNGKNECERRRKERLRAINRRLIREEKLRRGCELCGRQDLPHWALHFHHRDAARKRRKISAMTSAATEALIDELAQCRLWCRWSHNHFHQTGEIRFCPQALAARPAEMEVFA
jgi:hypothetical protein